jgi:hypothetical protein
MGHDLIEITRMWVPDWLVLARSNRLFVSGEF